MDEYISFDNEEEGFTRIDQETDSDLPVVKGVFQEADPINRNPPKRYYHNDKNIENNRSIYTKTYSGHHIYMIDNSDDNSEYCKPLVPASKGVLTDKRPLLKWDSFCLTEEQIDKLDAAQAKKKFALDETLDKIDKFLKYNSDINVIRERNKKLQTEFLG